MSKIIIAKKAIGKSKADFKFVNVNIERSKDTLQAIETRLKEARNNLKASISTKEIFQQTQKYSNPPTRHQLCSVLYRLRQRNWIIPIKKADITNHTGSAPKH